MFNSYNDIKKEYERIRLNRLLEYNDLKEKIYADNPALKEMDLKIVKCYLDIGRNRIDGLSVDAIEKELKELNESRKKYLVEHNITDDYKELKYNCEKCKDTGFVNGKKCSCFIQKEIELFDNISHFKNYIEEDNFENLDPNFYRQDDVKIGNLPYMKYMENLVEHIKRGIRLMDEMPYNLIMIGASGTGKTFLARCAGAMALKNNKSVLYENVNEYLNSLKPDFDGEPLRQYAVECDLFILDDLGTEKISEFTNTEINYIIDKRLNDKKSTIVTTNLMFEDIAERYLSPTYSRLSHSYIKCCLFGEDLRRVKNANI